MSRTTSESQAPCGGGQPQHIGESLREVLAAASAAHGFRFDPDAPAPPDPGPWRPTPDDRLASLIARGVPERAARVIAAPVVSLGAGGQVLRAEVLQDSRAVHVVRRWLMSSAAPPLLVLAGPKDSSKTTAAGLAVAETPWQRVEELPVMVPFEFSLGAWYATGERDEQTGLRRRDLFSTNLLVLDDVGQEAGDLIARFAEVLDVLLARRLDLGKRTVVTTNLVDERNTPTADVLLKHYASTGRSGRIGERITEYGYWCACPVEGFRAPLRRQAVLAEREGKGS